MSHRDAAPFENIESAHQYVALLVEAIEESRLDVEDQIKFAMAEHADRRKEALLLAAHKLTKLASHMHESLRILNDLRTLHRLLHGEQASATHNHAALPPH